MFWPKCLVEVSVFLLLAETSRRSIRTRLHVWSSAAETAAVDGGLLTEMLSVSAQRGEATNRRAGKPCRRGASWSPRGAAPVTGVQARSSTFKPKTLWKTRRLIRAFGPVPAAGLFIEPDKTTPAAFNVVLIWSRIKTLTRFWAAE